MLGLVFLAPVDASSLTVPLSHRAWRPRTDQLSRHPPAPQQKAWTTANPRITGRSNSAQQLNHSNSVTNKPLLISFFNRVREVSS